MIDYNIFKKIFNIITGEPEFEIYFKNRDDTYMIIKYNDYVTFQKCFDEQDRGEQKYKTIDDLYNSILLDEINLKNDWNSINDILIDSSFSIVDDKDEIKRIYNINLE